MIDKRAKNGHFSPGPFACLFHGDCMYIDEKFLTAAVKDAIVLQGTFPYTNSFSIDTRTVQEGDIFIALAGERTDGHDFVHHALEKKAAGIIIDEKKRNL